MEQGVYVGFLRNTKLVFVFAGIASLVFLLPFQQAVAESTSSKIAVQKNAIALARSGQHQPAIQHLSKLLKENPNNKSIQKDLIKVYAWAGNCPKAIRLYQSIQSAPISDSSLGKAVAQCLIEDERYTKAVAVLAPLIRKYKHDRAILDLYKNARNQSDARKNWFSYTGVEVARSDTGASETKIETELSRKYGDAATAYARINWAAGISPVLADGSLYRLGIGLQYRFINGITIKEEVSGSLQGASDPGLLSRINFSYSNKVQYFGEYSSYAEDIPLPAIGLSISADRKLVGADYHSDDYVFEGDFSIKQYQFSDSNVRNGVSFNSAYAYHRQPDRWRKIGLTIGHEQNTLVGPAYFNPADANTINVFHSMEIPRKTKHKRLIDILILRLGLFAQAGFASEPISELRYERKYTFASDAELELAAGIASSVYDGVRESESSVRFSYARSF